MASEITIKVGPLTATRNYNNDAKVSKMLMAYADDRRFQGTNQERLNKVLDSVIQMFVDTAVARDVQTANETAYEQAVADNTPE